ncbi:MAG: moderate conductance mechanosensitive channel [Chloroflexota bacterium]|nr:moderate conductance mechanosensitive channel [Chloroflexota bacterium]
MDTSEPLRWLLGRGIALLVGTVVLLVVYRVGVTAIHRVVPAVIHAQATHLPSGSSSHDETGKRITTIEDLLLRLLRVGVLAGLVVMVLAVFGWWNLLGGIVLLIAAIMFATRDVVLDYVMGFLLLVEGPFFQGDYVVVNGHPGVEGVVAEIGLRRTILRDGMGSSHAVSNGLIRLSSNRTRLFSVAVVDFTVPRAVDLDPALALAARVADEMRGDPAWADTFLADAPTEISVTGIGLDGPSVRLQQRVPTGDQGRVASELRRRMIAAMAAESIGMGRLDTPPPIAGQSST